MANRRRHGTTHRLIAAAFEAERPALQALQALPSLPFDAVMHLERRLSRDGCVRFNGNDYSVPDGVRDRSVEIEVSLAELRIFADGRLVASHPLSMTRYGRHFAAGHRRWPPPGTPHRRHGRVPAPLCLPGEQVGRRSLAVYERIGAALAAGEPAVTAAPLATLDRIRRHLAALKMPLALETLDGLVRRFGQGQLSP